MISYQVNGLTLLNNSFRAITKRTCVIHQSITIKEPILMSEVNLISFSVCLTFLFKLHLAMS